jgi:hypothetical protein
MKAEHSTSAGGSTGNSLAHSKLLSNISCLYMAKRQPELCYELRKHWGDSHWVTLIGFIFFWGRVSLHEDSFLAAAASMTLFMAVEILQLNFFGFRIFSDRVEYRSCETLYRWTNISLSLLDGYVIAHSPRRTDPERRLLSLIVTGGDVFCSVSLLRPGDVELFESAAAKISLRYLGDEIKNAS